jgi:Xaa-Pro dipeptidase
MTARIGTVRSELEAENLDALLICSPPNMGYLCGFRPNPHERLIALVVPRDGEPQLVCPSLEEKAARASVTLGATLHVWWDEEGPAKALAAALASAGRRIGIEKEYLTVAQAELATSAAPHASLVGCDELLARLRSVKSEEELDALRRAAAVVDRVVSEIGAAAAPGTTEGALAGDAATRLREEGGDSLMFEPLVLTGPRSALPHGRSGSQALAEGDLLIVDLGVSVDGYCGDITRTFVVAAEPNEHQREVFELVRAAQRAGVEAVRPGVPAREVDAAARGIITGGGYGRNFVHRTGHGLGLEVHEPPYLTATSEAPLQAGNVVTVEPGIYIDGWGGVRIEDDVVVREDGAEVLTHAPIDLAGSGARV